MIRKIVLSLIAVFSISAFAFGQKVQVSGTVTDDAGEALIGVSVSVKGTTSGTVTDLTGNYAISVPSNATLVFTYMGFTTQDVAVAGKTKVNVSLKSSTVQLEDIVVTGYGSGKKVGSTVGAVSRVKAEKIENKSSSNVADALQGQVAGLSVMTSSGEVNQASQIRLHGVGSIGAGNEPLILLDGAPISSSTLLTMNQNDIADIKILKDASATSIYGSRAANGVIYVSSKKGARGSESANITLRGQYTISNSITPKFKAMSTNQYLNYRGAYYAAQTAWSKGGGDEAKSWEWFRGNVNLKDMGEVANYRSQVLQGMMQQLGGATIPQSTNVDWFDQVTRDNAPQYQVDLSVSGGSEKTSYYFSGSYVNQTGIFSGSDMSRYTFRTNVDTKVTSWAKLGLGVGIGYNDYQMASSNSSGQGMQASNPVLASIFIPPFQTPYDKNGKELDYLEFYKELNPNSRVKYYDMSNNTLQIDGSTFLELTPFKGFTFRSTLSVLAQDGRSHFSESPARPMPGGLTLGSGYVSESFSRFSTWNWSNTAEYKFSFAKKNNMIVLLGHESLTRESESLGISSKGHTMSKYMYVNKGLETNGLPSYDLSRAAYNSGFARLEYNYDERYFVDGSVRLDACSRFGTSNRTAVFWSVGGMWKLKNEAFLKGVDAINRFDFKVSYGTQGNSGIGDYAQYEYYSSGLPYNGVVSWQLANTGNPYLAWEKQSTFNAGVAIDFYRKFSVELDFYNRATKDMLMSKPLPLSGGASSEFTNVGAMSNTGVDLTFSYDIYTSKDWYVNFRTTFNYNKNQLTKLWDDSATFEPYSDVMYYSKGEAFPVYVMPKWEGVNKENGRPQWKTAAEYVKSEGSVTSDFSKADMAYNTHKSFNAPFSGGFSLNVAWKGLALTADFSWVAGNYLLNNNLYFFSNPYFGLYSGAVGCNQITEAWDFWKAPGDNAKYPSPFYFFDATNSGGTQFDTRMLEDASFLRLKNIQLSYSFPQSLLNRQKIVKGFKVYVSARNLMTATAYTGFDPEAAAGGIDADIYPNSQQWTFGAELKF